MEKEKFKFKRGEIVRASCDYYTAIEQDKSYVVSRLKHEGRWAYVQIISELDSVIWLSQDMFRKRK